MEQEIPAWIGMRHCLETEYGGGCHQVLAMDSCSSDLRELPIGFDGESYMEDRRIYILFFRVSQPWIHSVSVWLNPGFLQTPPGCYDSYRLSRLHVFPDSVRPLWSRPGVETLILLLLLYLTCPLVQLHLYLFRLCSWVYPARDITPTQQEKIYRLKI